MTETSLTARLDDSACMRAIARGNTDALGVLYERHKDNVLGLAMRILGHWNLAEDVCQETFLRIQRAAGTYQPQAEFTTWLYRIVLNLCLDEKRRQSRLVVTGQPLETLACPSVCSVNPVDMNEVSDAIRKALNRLNERQRTAVILHKLEGLSHAQIALKTGWTQSTVESLLVRAYRKLRKEINAAMFLDS